MINYKIGYTFYANLGDISNVSLLYWLTNTGRSIEAIQKDTIFFIEVNADPGPPLLVDILDVVTGKSLSDNYFGLFPNEFNQYFRPDVLQTFKYKMNKEREPT